MTANIIGSVTCIDSITFKTSDNSVTTCDARSIVSTPENRPTSPNDKKIFYIPATDDLAELDIWANGDCVLGRIKVLTHTLSLTPQEQVDLTVLDISNVKGRTKKIFLSTVAEDYTITASSPITSGVTYSLEISPTLPVASNLITLDSTTSPSKITFALSTNLNDAQVYTIKLKATFPTAVSPVPKYSDAVTFEYINPCKSATITATAHPAFSTSVLVPKSQSTSIWNDNVSTA